MKDNEFFLRHLIRRRLIIFIMFLVLSGLTAFPIEAELGMLVSGTDFLPLFIQDFLATVYNALRNTNSEYPFLSYGTDWLAFAHLVIAVVFIGPLKDPIRNIWVLQFGRIACLMVFPLALLAGPLRSIPIWWQMVDCSFGFFGFLLINSIYSLTVRLATLRRAAEQNTFA